MKVSFDLETGPDVVPLFVYGTLRTGGALHYWVRMDVVDREPGIAVGYSLRNNGAYPIMVREPGQVTYGEILWVRRGKALTRTIDMEVGSGYDMEIVDVDTDSVNVPLPALSFLWKGSFPRWPRVPSNDWMAA